MSGHYRSYDDAGNQVAVYHLKVLASWSLFGWLLVRRYIKEGWEYSGRVRVGLFRTLYFVNRLSEEGDR